LLHPAQGQTCLAPRALGNLAEEQLTGLFLCQAGQLLQTLPGLCSRLLQFGCRAFQVSLAPLDGASPAFEVLELRFDRFELSEQTIVDPLRTFRLGLRPTP